MNKKVFTAVMLFVGSTIGAGFATGKEIVVFFTKYGILCIPNIIIYGCFYGYMTYIFMKKGQDKTLQKDGRVHIKIFKKHAKIESLFFHILFLVIMASMFGAFRELIQKIFPNCYFVFEFIFVAILVLMSYGNIQRINFVHKICAPLIIFFITILFANYQYSEPIVTQANVMMGFLSALCYASFNILITGSVMAKVSKSMTQKEIKQTCVLGSIILSLLILLLSLMFLFSGDIVLGVLPTITVAYQLSSVLGGVGFVIILLAILTTMLSVQMIEKDAFLVNGKSNLDATLYPIVLSYWLSLCGFEKMIGYGYPIIGFVGLLFCIVLICKFYINQKMHKV